MVYVIFSWPVFGKNSQVLQSVRAALRFLRVAGSLQTRVHSITVHDPGEPGKPHEERLVTDAELKYVNSYEEHVEEHGGSVE